MSRPHDLRVGERSDPGPVRPENQDRVTSFEAPLGRVFAVADGMGGHRDGARAAELVLAGLERHLGREPEDADPVAALDRAARGVSGDLAREIETPEDERRSPGSTLALALLTEQGLFVAHAGDSRVYRFREGRLERLTRDHTLVRRLVEDGTLSEEQARKHPEAHVIDRAFTPKNSVELEISTHRIQPGDRLLLCSDGLSGYVGDEEIERIAAPLDDPEHACQRLVEAALEAGSEDNVSVQMVSVDALSMSIWARPWRPAVLAAAVLLALLVGGLLGLGLSLWQARSREPPTEAMPRSPAPAQPIPGEVIPRFEMEMPEDVCKRPHATDPESHVDPQSPSSLVLYWDRDGARTIPPRAGERSPSVQRGGS